eukprot:5346803-Amphidinium_carterae.1
MSSEQTAIPTSESFEPESCRVLGSCLLKQDKPNLLVLQWPKLPEEVRQKIFSTNMENGNEWDVALRSSS